MAVVSFLLNTRLVELQDRNHVIWQNDESLTRRLDFGPLRSP